MRLLPVLLKDGYKVGHKFQYPEGTTLVYSNLTPRKARNEDVNEIVFFGLQYRQAGIQGRMYLAGRSNR